VANFGLQMMAVDYLPGIPSSDSKASRIGASGWPLSCSRSSRATPPNAQQLEDSRYYNKFCKEFCARNPKKFFFIGVDEIVNIENVLDLDHFSRAGYWQISKYIMKMVQRIAQVD
jgi:hypothetical protein